MEVYRRGRVFRRPKCAEARPSCLTLVEIVARIMSMNYEAVKSYYLYTVEQELFIISIFCFSFAVYMLYRFIISYFMEN